MSLTAKAIAIAAICGLLLSALWGYGRRERLAGRAEVQAMWDVERARLFQVGAEAEAAASRVEAERLKLSQEIARDAQKKVARARADAASAAAAAGGLLDAARAAAGRCASVNSTPAGRGAADSLADVLAEVERAGRAMAAEADAAVIAGQACEAAYSSIAGAKPVQKPGGQRPE